MSIRLLASDMPISHRDTRSPKIRQLNTVIFKSHLHSFPRNSGVVQTSMDTPSAVPCMELHSAQ